MKKRLIVILLGLFLLFPIVAEPYEYTPIRNDAIVCVSFEVGKEYINVTNVYFDTNLVEFVYRDKKYVFCTSWYKIYEIDKITGIKFN